MTVTATHTQRPRLRGRGRGAAVLLMHAGLNDRRTWDGQWAALAERFHAIRYDARGFGASADPTRPYTLHGDALDVLDALEIERAAVVGALDGWRRRPGHGARGPAPGAALVTVNSTPSGWHHSREIIVPGRRSMRRTSAQGVDAANELEMKMWLDGPHRLDGRR